MTGYCQEPDAVSSPSAARSRCSTAVDPFRIEIPQNDVDDLSERLSRTRWPDEPWDTGWQRGVPVRYLRQLADYWQSQYDWRRYEAELNALPHFTTIVDGERVHFIDVPGPDDVAMPLLLLHGWPGSIVEFLDIIEPLSHDFHLVIPSLPGHGLSGPITQPGWTDGRMADAFLELMGRLGHRRFGIQGGDTGAFIAPEIGRKAPDRVIGIHLNALVTFPSEDPSDLNALNDRERERLARHKAFRETGMGYAQIQGTRPHTIAYGLTDSPVAQLAWIVEKFKEWTDPAAELPEEAVDRDRLLTNVMLYWLTGTARSSADSYYERFHDPAMWTPKKPSGVPTGVAVFPTDVAIRLFAERAHRIVHWSEFGRGGHFAAMEAPGLLIDDVRAFFRTLV
ncbi:MAG TPA: epoxide hydrolase [Acidimicrobiales bacterium]